MTVTDAIIVFCSIFLLWKGAAQGFLVSLLGPLALIFATIVSIVYYIWTKDLFISLCIGLLGPFILAWIFHFFLRSWTQMTNPTGKLSLTSRIGGAALTWIWGMIMVGITVLLLGMAPPINKPLRMMYEDIHTSFAYHMLKPFDFSAVENKDQPTDLQSLYQDKRLQDIINDPQIIAAVHHQDYTALMSNPKIVALTQDPALIKKMMAIYKQMYQQQYANP